MDENIYKFIEFVYDRQLIWYKKEVLHQPAPWTDDPILSTCLFCNVYRELDHGTKYLIDSIHKDPQLSLEDKFLNIVFYRFFNNREFFGGLIPDAIRLSTFNFEEIEKSLDNWRDNCRANNKQFFRSCYLICSQPFPGNTYRKGEKHIQVLKTMEWLVNQVRDGYLDKILKSDEQGAWQLINDIPLIGDFLAYEIYCDLCYENLTKFSDNDFVNVGPGAYWGVVNILGKEVQYPEALEFTHHLRDIQVSYFDKLREEKGKDWNLIAYHGYSNAPYLSLRNIEHSCCEWRKLVNLRKGKGKRRYYRAE